MPDARIATSSFSVFTLFAATAAVAVGAFAWVETVIVASSGGVRSDSAILTRTSGVFAISPMLAIGAGWASATPGTIITAEKTTIFKDLPNATKFSLTLICGAQGYDSTLERFLNTHVSHRSTLLRALERLLSTHCGH